MRRASCDGPQSTNAHCFCSSVPSTAAGSGATPMGHHRLARPHRAGLPARVVANRDDKIQIFYIAIFVPRLAARRARINEIFLLQHPLRQGVDPAGGHRAPALSVSNRPRPLARSRYSANDAARENCTVQRRELSWRWWWSWQNPLTRPASGSARSDANRGAERSSGQSAFLQFLSLARVRPEGRITPPRNRLQAAADSPSEPAPGALGRQIAGKSASSLPCSPPHQPARLEISAGASTPWPAVPAASATNGRRTTALTEAN